MVNCVEICGFFSINSDREYKDSASSLRYFIKPDLPIDLNVGLDKLKAKPEAYYREKIENILTFIVNHKTELTTKTGVVPSDDCKLIPCAHFITYRGILRKIMCSRVSPYPWTIIATKYKGNIYLSQYTSPDDREREENLPAEVRRFCDYGPMFEHCCLSERPDEKPDASEACDASTQFFCVFKRSLVNRKFLFAGEMDGTDSKTPLNPNNLKEWTPSKFVELKMNCELRTKNRRLTFENVKVHSIWAQSYLTGVEKVHIGFRDDRGIVKEIRRYSIDELEEISKRNWKSSKTAMEFLDYFLSVVEDDLKDTDCPYTTIEYRHQPKTKLLPSVQRKGKTEYSLLPEWYLQKMSET